MIDLESTTLLRAGGATVAGIVFWLMYVDIKDQLRPEPRHMLVLALILGCGAAGLSLAVFRALGALGIGFPYGGSSGAIAAFCLLVIGPVEEGAKFAVTRFVLLRSRHFDEHLDGFVYPCAVAIGFAGAESLSLAAGESVSNQLARAAVGPAVHSVFAMIWGYGLAHAAFAARTRRARVLWQVLPLGAAMLAHGLYDFALLGLGATWLASIGIGVLWLVMVRSARVLLARDRARAPGISPWM